MKLLRGGRYSLDARYGVASLASLGVRRGGWGDWRYSSLGGATSLCLGGSCCASVANDDVDELKPRSIRVEM